MRAKTKLFTIGGQPILVPDADVTVEKTDIEGDRVRDRSGMLHRTVLRQVRAWEFSYSQLTDGERTYLAGLLEANPFQFAHPEGKSTCYCKAISAELHDGTTGLWQNVRFRVEEV